MENLKKEKPENIGKVLMAAGYSKETADTGNSNIIRSTKMRAALAPLTNQFERLKNEVIQEITKRKLKSSSAESLVRMADLLHKNERLVNGESTENVIQVSIDM